ncbi:MAG: hypothetical protein L3J16_06445, partial [Anaerolineales bacterium]|nr:hypothetical protein [Anaerolineales bacterium]
MSDAQKSDANTSPQEVLAGILDQLKSDQVEERAQAVAALDKIQYSSQIILKQLEKMAVNDHSIALRAAALDALDSPVHRQIFKKASKLPQFTRDILIREIDNWHKDGLLRQETAAALKKRYAFDRKIASAPDPKSAPAKRISAPSQTSLPLAQARKPKHSLAQALFSEASIKIALYLGAFFVIAAALIFAAIIEELRLPILLLITAGFLIGALMLKKRLPQPSFTLFIIFSTLLTIDAGVLADMLNLHGNDGNIYWTVVYLLIAALWGFSVWLYQSRFFSVAAFIALMLSAANFASIFDTPLAFPLLMSTFVAGSGLMAARFLKQWKDLRFANPLFLLSELSLLVILPISFVSLLLMDAQWSNTWWLAGGLTWTLVAAGFAFSNSIVPMKIIPYLAVATLIPIPWITLNGFGSQTSPVQIFVAWLWGTLFVAASVTLATTKRWEKYRLPFLLGSGLALLGALTLAGIRTLDINQNTSLFFVLLGIAATYAMYHVYKPQLL